MGPIQDVASTEHKLEALYRVLASLKQDPLHFVAHMAHTLFQKDIIRRIFPVTYAG